MTAFEIRKFSMREPLPENDDARLKNWPVVYALNGGKKIYVGETLSATSRLRQHQASESKRDMRLVRLLLHEHFNKSAALDLESHLIRWLAGDGKYEVINRNHGIVDADYHDRETYRGEFPEIFEALREAEIFERSIPEIENSDLFKLSPFKTLTPEQALAVEDLLRALRSSLESGTEPGSLVIQGDPGTGKTVVAVYLMKLLSDIATVTDEEIAEDLEGDSRFSEFFTPEFREALQDFPIGLVVPQQALRKSIQAVFKRTPQLSKDMVLDPFSLGKSDQHYSLLIVDETHRLNQRANQSSGVRNRDFREINEKLFGEDSPLHTQLDWVRQKSDHQVLLLDAEQSVRPADLSRETVDGLVSEAKTAGKHVTLASQLRLNAGDEYMPHIRRLLRGQERAPAPVGDYEFCMYSDVSQMYARIRQLDAEYGLARMAAGYAWDWVTKSDGAAYDFELDGVKFCWNSTDVDWVNSPNALEEVGSIHTLQGYDLNYAGVIIGPDLRYDPATAQVYFDRSNYFDTKGKENNKKLGIQYTDDDILDYVQNIYRILLTRGIKGTLIYVCDPDLREYMARFIPPAERGRRLPDRRHDSSTEAKYEVPAHDVAQGPGRFSEEARR